MSQIETCDGQIHKVNIGSPCTGSKIKLLLYIKNKTIEILIRMCKSKPLKQKKFIPGEFFAYVFLIYRIETYFYTLFN